MKILSDDLRILDELFIYLDEKDIEVEKIKIESDSATDNRPMDGLVPAILILKKTKFQIK